VAEGIVTGLHEKGRSHFALLAAFAPRHLLERAHAFADASGYQDHEFGDAMLILGDRAAARRRAGGEPLALRTS
jgi:S-adenosylmethionine:tRNA ribosyltransferase-isomerase